MRGHGGIQSFERRGSHIFTDDGEVDSLNAPAGRPFAQEDSLYTFLLGAESTPGP
jgi:hypothetical protein